MLSYQSGNQLQTFVLGPESHVKKKNKTTKLIPGDQLGAALGNKRRVETELHEVSAALKATRAGLPQSDSGTSIKG